MTGYQGHAYVIMRLPSYWFFYLHRTSPVEVDGGIVKSRFGCGDNFLKLS